MVGWWIRGFSTSGRELTLKREFGHRLTAVEEDGRRTLERIRLEAESQLRRLASERDAMHERLFELDPEAANRLSLPITTVVPFIDRAIELEDESSAVADDESGDLGVAAAPEGTPAAGGSNGATDVRLEPTPSLPPSSAIARRPRKTHRPTADTAPAAGPDDLKLIKGIGPAFERRLNEMGYTRFEEVAGWSAQDLERLGEHLGSRIRLEEWAARAKQLHHKFHGHAT